MVVTHHDCAYERYPSLFRHAPEIMRMRARQFSKADAIICPSEATRLDLHRFYDVPEHKTFVVYHGIARLLPTSAGLLPRKRKPFLLYVGSRAPYKNFHGLLFAFAAAGLQSSFDIVVVGGGPPRRGELEQIWRAGLSDSVHFMDRLSDDVLAACYEQAHLLVYPSLYEGFGFPPLEAMALGCPVVAARASCLPEICGPAACLFDPDSEDAFVEALKLSCYDEEWRRKAIVLGRDHARQYTWQDCARNTLSVYETVKSSV
jgi:glycosyltransferase involved in cell wall biosynthesis